MVKLKSITTILPILITLCTLFFAFDFDLIAGDSGVRDFVDLDGDGFNDLQQNLIQGEMQGIPSENSAMDIFRVTNQLSNIPEAENRNSSEFDRYLFSVRALTCNRCSLDSDAGFGPGNGIGSGIILGGCCAGGVCRPY